MNRAQRRKQIRTKSKVSKAGLTYLTVAGVIGGTVGLASPAHAVAATDCTELASALTSLTTTGGSVTADFTATCDFAEGYVFQLPTAIDGPTNGTLNVRFTGSVQIGFDGQDTLGVSNINFTQSVGPNFLYFIRSWQNRALIVSNSTFSDPDAAPGVDVASAIYAEGSLQVSDSAFTNLTSLSNGAAIRVDEYLGNTTIITDSSFESNESGLSGAAVWTNNNTLVNESTFKSNSTPNSGGAIYSEGGVILTIESSTFELNEALNGGAIYNSDLNSIMRINNSTFVENSAPNAAAISLSEGSVIRNSTFWNNKASVATSGTLDGGFADFFGNILANDDASRVIGDGGSVGDLGANLFTDSSFVVDATRPGDGASELVSVTDLDIGLGVPNLNSTNPENSGATKTIEIGTDSVALDFYGTTSTGIAPPDPGPSPFFNYASLDQRGVSRPLGSGYDVGAFESGASPSEETEKENLADTGLPTNAGYLGLVGLGAAAILGGSAGLLRRRKKA